MWTTEHPALQRISSNPLFAGTLFQALEFAPFPYLVRDSNRTPEGTFHMKSMSSLAVCTAAVLGVSALVAQSPSPSAATTSTTTSPVARVYVAYQTSSSALETVGYYADSEGRLTPISGGPWAGMAEATTGTYLFTLSTNFRNLATYRVSSSGALSQVANYDLANRAPAGCADYETFGPVTLDHTGATVYATGSESASGAGEGDCDDNTVTQAYKINKSTGDLTYLGSVDGYYELSFASNNEYAFSGGGSDGEDIAGLKRASDGMLALASSTSDQPMGAPSGTSWYVAGTAADPSGHLAVALEPEQSPWKSLLAAYSTDANGNVTTTNTYDQMPTLNEFIGPMQMSPSGKLLAVGDDNEGGTSPGLHVFHFNGASPITPYALLLSGEVTAIGWDNDNHLYATTTGNSAWEGKLYVFTVTPTSWSQAPGSPYTISSGVGANIVVRSLTSQ